MLNETDRLFIKRKLGDIRNAAQAVHQIGDARGGSIAQNTWDFCEQVNELADEMESEIGDDAEDVEE